ncbi:MAG: helix-turn-helix domain-containing protein [Anaerolineae bacterium]
MEQIRRILNQRIDRVTRPEPTITIFNGHQFYITDTGTTGKSSQVSVQLSVRFREKQLRQLKGPVLAVFVCIALHINEEGRAWPSAALIAKETGYNEDTVFSCLKNLEFMGYISRVQMSNKGTGRFGSNVYQLFPKSRRRKTFEHHRNEPSRVLPGTVAPVRVPYVTK